MTDYQEVYDAFLAKITADEWNDTFDDPSQDWRQIMESAIFHIRLPREDLKRDATGFENNLSDDTIQLIAYYMKEEWVSRHIATWQNLNVIYDERDFSQGNLIAKFSALLRALQASNAKLYDNYSRTRVDQNGKKVPYSYSRLSGSDI